jgi:hypothetical protein
LELCSKVRVDLGHVWVDKRAVIAKKVEDLGDQFCSAMPTKRLAYIKNSANAIQHDPALGQGELAVEDDE